MAIHLDVARLLRPIDRRSSKEIEADILEELQTHIELATRANVEAGMDPDAARREAEERFGDLAEVFGACRTEKLRSRIMLQRALFVLVFLLIVAVGVQAFQLYDGRLKNERMRAELAEMALRLELPVDVDAAKAHLQRRLEQLRIEQAKFKPAHSKWRALQEQIEDLEEELHRLESASLEATGEIRYENTHETEPAAGSPEWRREQEGRYKRHKLLEGLLRGDAESFSFAIGIGPSAVTELTTVLRDPSAGGFVRLEAVRALAEIGESPALDQTAPLLPGDRVSVYEPDHAEQLNFTREVDDQGNLLVPEVGLVHVVGLTRSEVTTLLQGKLEPYFLDLDLRVSKKVPVQRVLWDALEAAVKDDPDQVVRGEAARALEALR